MARKTTWKDFHITSGWQWSALRSYYLSSKGAWSDYSIEFEQGSHWIVTNLPWDELRRWFTFACVPFPKDVLTSKEYPYPDED